MITSRSAPLIGAVSAEVVRFGTSVIVLMAFGYALGFRIGLHRRTPFP